jgi:hypothetical protein
VNIARTGILKFYRVEVAAELDDLQMSCQCLRKVSVICFIVVAVMKVPVCLFSLIEKR